MDWGAWSDCSCSMNHYMPDIERIVFQGESKWSSLAQKMARWTEFVCRWHHQAKINWTFHVLHSFSIEWSPYDIAFPCPNIAQVCWTRQYNLTQSINLVLKLVYLSSVQLIMSLLWCSSRIENIYQSCPGYNYFHEITIGCIAIRPNAYLVSRYAKRILYRDALVYRTSPSILSALFTLAGRGVYEFSVSV